MARSSGWPVLKSPRNSKSPRAKATATRSPSRKLRKAFSAKQIAKRVDKLAAEIRKDAGDAAVFLLGVRKGTPCFLSALLRAVRGPAGYGCIDVVRDAADALPGDAI